jgi:hypothetical protein
VAPPLPASASTHGRCPVYISHLYVRQDVRALVGSACQMEPKHKTCTVHVERIYSTDQQMGAAMSFTENASVGVKTHMTTPNE